MISIPLLYLRQIIMAALGFSVLGIGILSGFGKIAGVFGLGPLGSFGVCLFVAVIFLMGSGVFVHGQETETKTA